jgi:thioester reductase-like protein
MQYFVTGATGFIGKRLVKTLLARRGTTVHFLVRPGSEGKLADLYDYWGVSASARCRQRRPHRQEAGRVGRGHQGAQGPDRPCLPPGRGVRPVGRRGEPGPVNIEGTRNMVEFAKAIDAGHVHHVSSIAAAGLYEGVFREDMFDEAEGLDHPYFMTKHESEKIVRKECKVPWTVYRPAWWWATAPPARWTRSTAPTTSSS